MVTALLVFVTWRYAKSTEVIAHETAVAAKGARATARISLLQSLLAVQPLLDVHAVEVEYWRGGPSADLPRGGIPFRLIWSVTNTGSGTAFKPKFSCRVAENVLEAEESIPSVPQILPGDEVKVRHHVDPAELDSLASQLMANQELDGEFSVCCIDSYGASVDIEVDVRIDTENVFLGERRRRYEEGDELRLMLKRLVDDLRGDGQG